MKNKKIQKNEVDEMLVKQFKQGIKDLKEGKKLIQC